MSKSRAQDRRLLLLVGALCLLVVAGLVYWSIYTRSLVAQPRNANISHISKAPELQLSSSLDEPAQATRDSIEPGTTTSKARLPRTALEPVEGRDLVSVVIQVQGEEFEPIPDAELVVRTDDRVYNGKTDEHGEFELKLSRLDGWLTIETSAPGYFHGRHRRPIASFIRTRLWKASLIQGQVFDAETREPLEATLFFSHERCERICSREQIQTDAEGRFEVSVSGSPEYAYFQVRADGYADLQPLPPIVTDPKLEIFLSKGSHIRGTVLDITTGEVVPGARVSDAHGSSCISDEFGRFDGWMRPNEPGELIDLDASAPGFLATSLTLNPLDSTSEAELEIPLIPGTSLVGRVTDQSDVPLSDVHISLDQSSSFQQGTRALRMIRDASRSPVTVNSVGTIDSYPSGSTDESGEFRLEGLLPWREDYSIKMYRDYRQLAEPTVLATGDPGSVQRVDLVGVIPEPRSAKVSGMLTLNGEPHPGKLAWHTPTDSGGTTANARGEYSFFASPGEAEITAQPDAHGNAFLSSIGYLDQLRLAEPEIVQLEPNRDYQLDIDLTLEVHALRGSVRRGSGEPIEGKLVHIANSRLDSVRTGPDGSFSLDLPVLEEGYEISLIHGGQQYSYTNLHPGDPPLEIVLPEEIDVFFRLRDAVTGAPIPRVAIGVRENSDPFYRARPFAAWPCDESAPDLLCAKAVAGPLDLVLAPPGYIANELGVVDLEEGLIVEAEFQPGLTIRIPLSPSNSPLPQSSSVYLIESGYEDSPSWTDYSGHQLGRVGRARDQSRLYFDYAEGHATIGDLAPGTYSFRSLSSEITFDPPTIEVQSGGTPGVVLRYDLEQ